MGRLIYFPGEFKSSERVEGNARDNVVHFIDHKRLRYKAREEGLSYREYREKLRLYDIDLETAVEMCHRGISTSDFLREREAAARKERSRLRLVRNSLRAYFSAVISASLIALAYTSIESSSLDNMTQESLSEDGLTDFYLRFGFQ